MRYEGANTDEPSARALSERSSQQFVVRVPAMRVRRESAPEAVRLRAHRGSASQSTVAATMIGVRSVSGELIHWGNDRLRSGRNANPHPSGIRETHTVHRAKKLVAARTILLAAPVIATGKVKKVNAVGRAHLAGAVICRPAGRNYYRKSQSIGG